MEHGIFSLLFPLVFVIGATDAGPGFHPTIKAKNQIEVVRYDADSNTFVVTSDGVPGDESKMRVTPKNLVKAVHTLTLEKVMKNPNYLSGTIYATDEDMDLVAPKNVVAKKAVPTKKASPTRMPASMGKPRFEK